MNARVLFSTVSYNQGGLLALSGATFLLWETKRTILLPERPLLTTRCPPAVLIIQARILEH